MARVDFDLDTPLAPEDVRWALLDFSDRRPQIWSGMDPSQYKVYETGETWADIREATVIFAVRLGRGAPIASSLRKGLANFQAGAGASSTD